MGSACNVISALVARSPKTLDLLAKRSEELELLTGSPVSIENVIVGIVMRSLSSSDDVPLPSLRGSEPTPPTVTVPDVPSVIYDWSACPFSSPGNIEQVQHVRVYDGAGNESIQDNPIRVGFELALKQGMRLYTVNLPGAGSCLVAWAPAQLLWDLAVAAYTNAPNNTIITLKHPTDMSRNAIVTGHEVVGTPPFRKEVSAERVCFRHQIDGLGSMDISSDSDSILRYGRVFLSNMDRSIVIQTRTGDTKRQDGNPVWSRQG
jgi:hypothetical protein